MFYQKKRKLVMEETNVTSVLTVINRHQGFFSNDNKIVRNYMLPKDPSKWVIKFNASDKEWSLMTADLSKIGEIIVKVTPGGTTDLYFIKS
jgi:hypothetical protein